MFYCDPCADKNKWPKSWSKSQGNCEDCGKRAVCNDIPSSQLPMPPLSDEDKKRNAELWQRLGF